MKRLLVLSLLIIVINSQAQMRIGADDALLTAERFLEQNPKALVTSLSLNETIPSEASGYDNLFVYAIKPKGFIIISARNEMLAYSFDSNLPKREDLPEQINYWIRLYNHRTDYLIDHPKLIPHSRNSHEIAPLLTSTWGQDCYFNEACPPDTSGPCGHATAGCVAIAMAQIMYYHKQPENGVGTITYNSTTYGTLSANFGETLYHWQEMVDHVHDTNNAVAQLVFHCGVGAKMSYGPNLSTTKNSHALNAFKQFFNYPKPKLSQRKNISDEEWFSLIKRDLDQGLPVYYSGYSDLGGHAFVCDGYDNNGLFHLNFGWYGDGDGYFALDDPSGFSKNQEIITNIFPVSSIPINADEHGIIYVTPDGTGDGSSWQQGTSKLHLAICKAQVDQDVIWVKEGTYYGDSLDAYAFNINFPCKMYGGFIGDEPFDYHLDLRNPAMRPSVLDGQQRQGVVNVSPFLVSDSTIIDGFTIQNGEAKDGAGIADNGGFSTYRNCIIRNNTARHMGGGVMYKDGTKQCVFINCTITNNTAKFGGGVGSPSGENPYAPSTKFWNCLIKNNSAQSGGGIYLAGNVCFYNCTIVKNNATIAYGGVNSPFPKGALINSILWGNESPDENTQMGPYERAFNSVVQNADSSEFTINAESENDGTEPRFYVRFADPDIAVGIEGQGGNWRLKPNSNCIDIGTVIDNQTATDLDGMPRHRHNNVDMGAYETNSKANFVNASLCTGTDFIHNDSIISEPGLYTFWYRLPSYDSLEVIQATITGTHTTVHKSISICEGETYPFCGSYLSEPGHYTSTIDCTTYELDLTVLPSPIIQCTNDTLVDYGIPIQLNVSGADSYLWSTGDTTAQITVMPETDMTYTVKGTSVNGCNDKASVTVTVRKNPDTLLFFPNPANNKVKIFIPEIQYVEILTLDGQRLDYIDANSRYVVLDVNHYANGLYLVHVGQSSNHYYRKLVVQH